MSAYSGHTIPYQNAVPGTEGQPPREPALCPTAARLIGIPAGGARSQPTAPGGCYLELSRTEPKIYFNDLVGAPAGGLMQRPVCVSADYYADPTGSNDCTDDFQRMGTAEQCRTAAAAVGRPFKGSGQWATEPAVHPSPQLPFVPEPLVPGALRIPIPVRGLCPGQG